MSTQLKIADKIGESEDIQYKETTAEKLLDILTKTDDEAEICALVEQVK